MEGMPKAKVEKRFAPSREEFAQKRLEALKKTMDALKKEKPEVLSFAMFGSMARGNARQESDIDGYLFVDVSSQEQDQNNNEILEERIGERTKDTLFSKSAERSYREAFTRSMTEYSDMSLEQVEQGLKVRPVSERIIKSDLERLLVDASAELEYDTAFAKWKQEAEKGWPDLEKELEHSRSAPKRPANLGISPSNTLVGMFHLDVGGGLGPYRAKVIEELEKHGEVGERVWKTIIQGTEMMENYLRTTNKQYPRTLAEARAIYAREKA